MVHRGDRRREVRLQYRDNQQQDTVRPLVPRLVHQLQGGFRHQRRIQQLLPDGELGQPPHSPRGSHEDWIQVPRMVHRCCRRGAVQLLYARDLGIHPVRPLDKELRRQDLHRDVQRQRRVSQHHKQGQLRRACVRADGPRQARLHVRRMVHRCHRRNRVQLQQHDHLRHHPVRPLDGRSFRTDLHREVRRQRRSPRQHPDCQEWREGGRPCGTHQVRIQVPGMVHRGGRRRRVQLQQRGHRRSDPVRPLGLQQPQQDMHDHLQRQRRVSQHDRYRQPRRVRARAHVPHQSRIQIPRMVHRRRGRKQVRLRQPRDLQRHAVRPMGHPDPELQGHLRRQQRDAQHLRGRKVRRLRRRAGRPHKGRVQVPRMVHHGIRRGEVRLHHPCDRELHAVRSLVLRCLQELHRHLRRQRGIPQPHRDRGVRLEGLRALRPVQVRI